MRWRVRFGGPKRSAGQRRLPSGEGVKVVEIAGKVLGRHCRKHVPHPPKQPVEATVALLSGADNNAGVAPTCGPTLLV